MTRTLVGAGARRLAVPGPEPPVRRRLARRRPASSAEPVVAIGACGAAAAAGSPAPAARPARRRSTSRRGRASDRRARARTRSWPLGRPTWHGAAGDADRAVHRARSYRAVVEPFLLPLAEVDDAPAVRGGRLRRLLLVGAPRREHRPDLPAGRRPAHAELEAPADRLPRPVRHGRRLRAPTSSGRTVSARRRATPAPTFGPSIRLDIEAEVGFVVGDAEPRSARRSPTSAVRDHVFGVVLRQRLERSRHPGLGVRPARAVPRQVVPDLDLAVGGPARRARGGDGPAAGAGPGAAALPRRPAVGPRPRARGPAQRRGGRRGRRSRRCTGRRPSSSRT